jgi:peptidoglycan hydrolase-like protein with peptidoglycan-binding domain
VIYGSRRRRRRWPWAIVAVLLLLAAAAVAALVAWPKVRLDARGDGLAGIDLPRFAGRVSAVDVRAAGAERVPVRVQTRSVVPTAKLDSGERLTVTVTVRRPSWAGWLVGRTERRTFTVVTPRAPVVERWLEPKLGTPVRARFDAPVELVALNRRPAHELGRPTRAVPLGVVARGASTAGSVTIAAAARPWERLSRPVRISWFAARSSAQLLARPKPDTAIGPGRTLALTFARPVRDLYGKRLPKIVPASPGRWVHVDAHTLAFRPSGLGFGLGATVRVRLPQAARLAGDTESKPVRILRWHVPDGSVLRLQQLLAQLGYLPVAWHPAGDPPDTRRTELAEAIAPPAGRFAWRYRKTPAPLKALWRPGTLDEVTRGAIMSFEDSHALPVDGLAGPVVWRAVILDALAGKRRTGGYSYVFVHRNLPQSLNLWHNGRVILTSPGNTGVPSAPTALGTWPVFEHIPVGTMSGTNPDGSHYNDPGIEWISYFHGGDAIHAFNRPSYGIPQSLGCVELPLDAAAKVWPYTPIGTLVTIEN